MYRVKITNKEDNRSWQAEFETREETEAWKNLQIVKEGRSLEEAEIYVIDLDQDQEYLNEQAIINRLKEYPSDLDIINTILDHGLDSDQYDQLQAKRLEVKEKYPLSDSTSKTKRIEKIYKQLNKDVYDKMKEVFGTRNPNSASAYHSTWKQMYEAPETFIGKGIKSRFDIGDFLVNDSLNTKVLLKDYANLKLNESNEYSAWRMNRIEQFRADRSVIINEV